MSNTPVDVKHDEPKRVETSNGQVIKVITHCQTSGCGYEFPNPITVIANADAADSGQFVCNDDAESIEISDED